MTHQAAPGMRGATGRAGPPRRAAAATVLWMLFVGLQWPSPEPGPPPRRPPPGREEAKPSGIWIDRAELALRPAAGPAWDRLLAAATQACPRPDLSNQDDPANVCVLAKALAYVRTGDPILRLGVIDALHAITSPQPYEGRALALGRELAAYVIAADVIDLKKDDPELDARFRERIRELLTTHTRGGPRSLVQCHELRPNNWGTWCGGSRAAVAAYLEDAGGLARVAQVFKGWLGDRSSYAEFRYGDRSWQCDPSAPVGINPKGCRSRGRLIDGVLPDDQRRGGRFAWPPPKEDYVYGALEGVLVQAVILSRAGYDVFEWQDRAILRAYEWLHGTAAYPATGNDEWQPHLVNYIYHTAFPAKVPATPGKQIGWTDWTHVREIAIPRPDGTPAGLVLPRR